MEVVMGDLEMVVELYSLLLMPVFLLRLIATDLPDEKERVRRKVQVLKD